MFYDKTAYQIWIDSFNGSQVDITIEKHRDKRTNQQNKALHLYFRLLADALNDAGYEISKIIKTDIPWNELLIKELLWRPVQKKYLDKVSTTDLDKHEDITAIYEILNRAIGEKTGVYVPFPSEEEQLNSLNKIEIN